MQIRHVLTGFLLILCAITIGLNLWLAANKPMIEFDESITLLAATANQQQYVDYRASLGGVLTSAGEWQALLQLDTPFAFATISNDLVNNDSHPPLYFWLLHVWFIITGTDSAFSANVNNIFISVMIAALLYVTTRRYITKEYALVAVILWLFSPMIFRSTYFVRHYLFFTLLTLLYGRVVYNIIVEQTTHLSRLQITQLFTYSFLMFLTHIISVTVVVAGAIVLLWDSVRRRQWRVLAWFSGMTIAAYGMMLAIFPGWLVQMTRSRNAPELTRERLLQNLENIQDFSLSFLVDIQYQQGPYWFVTPILTIGIPLMIVVLLVWQWQQQETKSVAWHGFIWLVFVGCIWGGMSFLHALGRIPLQYRYFAPALPFFILFIMYLLNLSILARIRLPLATLMIATIMLGGLLSARQIAMFNHNVGSPELYPSGSEFVLVHTNSRGHILQTIHNLDADTPVIIGDYEDLMSQPDLWLSEMAKYDETLLLGFPNPDFFAILQESGYGLERIDTYLYYTQTYRAYQLE